MVDMVLRSSTSVKLYFDRHPSGTGTLPSTPNTTVGAGDMGLNVGGIIGSLDEAAIYPSALSAADISTRWQTAVGATSCPSAPTTGYAGAVRSDGPNRYYRLNESSGGFALDSSSSCSPAAYAKSVTHDSGSLLSDPADKSLGKGTATGLDVVGTDDGLPTGSSDRTLEVWEKTPTTPPGSVYLLLYGSPGTAQQASIALYNGTNTSFCFCGSSDNAIFTAPYSLADGNWHQIAVTLSSGTSINAYVDGAPVGTTTTLSTTPSTVLGYFGLQVGGAGGSYGPTPFAGNVDEAAVYPSALSAAHIKAHFIESGHTATISTPVTAANAPT